MVMTKSYIKDTYTELLIIKKIVHTLSATRFNHLKYKMNGAFNSMLCARQITSQDSIRKSF